jgi:hypothetical protein
MNPLLRRHAVAAFVACGLALPAAATTSGTDYTDVWFNPAESGWGINLIQQGSTLFATMFVYGADRTPHWFVASEMNGGGSGFSGALLQTSGPAYNGPWTGGVTAPAVGSISVNFTSMNTATLSYTVNGQTITKSIQRQTFRGNNTSGQYYGGLVATTNCNPPNALAHGPFTVSHANPESGGTVGISLSVNGTPTCTFSGTYSAQGRLGTITGNATCQGVAGTFSMTEVDVSRNGFNAIFTMSTPGNGCNYNGYFGGTRDKFQ